jgi:hypothetical protein
MDIKRWVYPSVCVVVEKPVHNADSESSPPSEILELFEVDQVLVGSDFGQLQFVSVSDLPKLKSAGIDSGNQTCETH